MEQASACKGIDCLDAGADDYPTKAVRTDEVAPRLRAIIRRAAGRTGDRISWGGIELHPKTRMAENAPSCAAVATGAWFPVI